MLQRGTARRYGNNGNGSGSGGAGGSGGGGGPGGGGGACGGGRLDSWGGGLSEACAYSSGESGPPPPPPAASAQLRHVYASMAFRDWWVEPP